MEASADRLAACWGKQDCHSCLRSSHGCGWCASSTACVPASSIFDPLTNVNACPLKSERFELRTRALGCGCSTTTLLSIIVTVFATVAALHLLYGAGLLMYRLNQTLGTGTWRGVEVELKQDGTRVERPWRRRGWGAKVASLFRSERPNLDSRSQQEQVTERSRLMG